MKTLVKSDTYLLFASSNSFKKDLLFFNNIIYDIDTLDFYKKSQELTETIKTYINEIEFLVDKGFVICTSSSSLSNRFDEILAKAPDEELQEITTYLDGLIETAPAITPNQKAFSQIKKIIRSNLDSDQKLKKITPILNNQLVLKELKERFLHLKLRLVNNQDTYVIFNDSVKESFSKIANHSSNKQQVLKFLFTQIPTPDENLPWEAIIDYKSDADVKRKYYALIDWANEVTNSNMSISEIQDKYNYLLSEYISQLNLHKLKTQKTTFEIVINTSAEVIENLCRLKFSNITKSLFSIGKAKLDLLEAETKITGRELAYIYDVNQKFK